MPAEFVLEDGLIRWQGREVWLTAGEAQLLGLLYKRSPHFLPHERLASLMTYGGVQMIVHRLRKKIAGMPFGIETRYQYGYRLLGDLGVV